MFLFKSKDSTQEQINDSYMTLRQMIGILGMLLPFAVVLFATIFSKNTTGCFRFSSISATYHTNSRDIFVGLMFCVGLFLLTYDAYKGIDKVVNKICGASGMLLAFFPCSLQWQEEQHLHGGLFNLPLSISNYFHLFFAALFFIMLAVDSFFLFTRTNLTKTQLLALPKGNRKASRNVIYRICGIVIFLCLIALVVFSLCFKVNTPEGRAAYEDTWIALIIETIMLFAFGISWLTKGGAIWPDKELK